MFAKKDYLREKIDPKLTGNIRNAQKLYFTELNKNKGLKEEKRKVLNAVKEKALTKKAAKKLFEDAATKQKLMHLKGLVKGSKVTSKDKDISQKKIKEAT